MTTDTAPSTSATTDPAIAVAPIRTAWIAGGAAWVCAGLLFAGDGWRLTAGSAAWFVSDLLLLVGLFGLRRLRLHGDSRIGSGALVVAIVARLLFAAGEVATIAAGDDEGPLIPLGALLTAISLTTYAITVWRRRSEVGTVAWALLAMGGYPFVAMFPVLAVTGEPNSLLIALWGVPAVLVGFSLRGRRS